MQDPGRQRKHGSVSSMLRNRIKRILRRKGASPPPPEKNPPPTTNSRTLPFFDLRPREQSCISTQRAEGSNLASGARSRLALDQPASQSRKKVSWTCAVHRVALLLGVTDRITCGASKKANTDICGISPGAHMAAYQTATRSIWHGALAVLVVGSGTMLRL